VSAPSAEKLDETLRPLTQAPERAAIFCDVDGTLAPIVERADEAKVPERLSRVLGQLGRRYRLVACISGRSAADARRVVGVGTIAYAGTHGAEILAPGASDSDLMPELESWAAAVHAFAAERDRRDLRSLRVRIEDKGPIVAFHWRGAPDESAARERIEGIAAEAEDEGFHVHWGRKVLEVRPPVEISKGRAVRDLAERARAVRAALYGGDDVTDLDGFAALADLRSEGVLDAAVCVGVRSEEGPAEIVERADLVVEGIRGFTGVLDALASAAGPG
jgi:trehalose 6-phosphate phosphatase